MTNPGVTTQPISRKQTLRMNGRNRREVLDCGDGVCGVAALEKESRERRNGVAWVRRSPAKAEAKPGLPETGEIQLARDAGRLGHALRRFNRFESADQPSEFTAWIKALM